MHFLIVSENTGGMKFLIKSLKLCTFEVCTLSYFYLKLCTFLRYSVFLGDMHFKLEQRSIFWDNNSNLKKCNCFVCYATLNDTNLALCNFELCNIFWGHVITQVKVFLSKYIVVISKERAFAPCKKALFRDLTCTHKK